MQVDKFSVGHEVGAALAKSRQMAPIKFQRRNICRIERTDRKRQQHKKKECGGHKIYDFAIRNQLLSSVSIPAVSSSGLGLFVPNNMHQKEKTHRILHGRRHSNKSRSFFWRAPNIVSDLFAFSERAKKIERFFWFHLKQQPQAERWRLRVRLPFFLFGGFCLSFCLAHN